MFQFSYVIIENTIVQLEDILLPLEDDHEYVVVILDHGHVHDVPRYPVHGVYHV